MWQESMKTHKFLEHAFVEDAFWLAALVVFLKHYSAQCDKTEIGSVEVYELLVCIQIT